MSQEIPKIKVYKLIVEKLDKSRSGRSLCYVDQKIMEKMGLVTGDIILIKGLKKVSAIVVASIADKGKKTIRIDGLQRLNAGATIGEYVTIELVDVFPAEEIVLTPTKPIIDIKKQSEKIKGKLIDKPILINNIIDVPGTYVQKSEQGPMNEFMKMMPLFKGGAGRGLHYGTLRLIVENVRPSNKVVRVTRTTRIKISKRIALLNEMGEVITYDDVGGLSDEIQKIREIIELPLKHPEFFERLRITPPRGVLFYGPSGCGKTLLAKAVSQETNAHFVIINGPEIMSKFYGASEENLRAKFEEAENNAPSIILIDEIDSIAPKRENFTGEVERRVVAQLLTCLDGLQGRGEVIVIAATNRLNAIDPALRRPGRFDKEIVFKVPNVKGRKEIFQIHTRGMPLKDDVDLDLYAEMTHGFVGADIMAICKEAAIYAIKKALSKVKMDEKIPNKVIRKLKVKNKNFLKAIKLIDPSALRELMVEIPNVTWDNIGGLVDVKEELKEAVEWPLKHPKLFKKAGIRTLNGILLVGPPGCGKTLLAKAVATESNFNFITLRGPEIISKFVGESEKNIRYIFRIARQVKPSIIYFDEIDALTSNRGNDKGSHGYDSIVNQILAEMDGMQNRKGVIVMASTNRDDIVDPAFLRPGRFDRIINVKAPEYKDRLEILKIHSKKMPLEEDVSLEEIAQITKSFSGADIENLCREAGMEALREKKEKLDKVRKKHFDQALLIIDPTPMRDLVITTPNLKWDEVGGLESIKKQLKEAIEWPLKYPDLFKKAGVRPVKGILLYGPPGCGKTLLAKAVATESQFNFITVKGPEIISKYVGDSEKRIRDIFKKARKSAPTIIYFDDIDAISVGRGDSMGTQVYNSVVNQILTEMDGIESQKGVVIIASTNRPDIMDPSFLRAGRFDSLIYVDAPDFKERLKILKVHTRDMPLADTVSLKQFALITEGYSGADLENVCREAGMHAIRENMEDLTLIENKHFEQALTKIKSTLSKEMIDRYHTIEKEFAQSRHIKESRADLYR